LTVTDIDMCAIGYRKPSPALVALEMFEIPPADAGERDLLVVGAVAVNPVNYKVANGTVPEAGGIKVVGYDAAGVVVEVGRETRLFNPGNDVFYAGSIGRKGANAEYHLVDERIVGRKAAFARFPAAVLPLTSIAAWEAMFDRPDVATPVPGVVDNVVCAHSLAIVRSRLFVELADLIASQGHLALINGEAADVFVFVRKSVSVYYELMFTRPLFQTADIEAPHGLLNEVADLVESRRVRSTMSENYGRIDAANLMRAMGFLKSGRAIGKIVLSGF
jgi:NADPH:quinone reductase